MVLGCFCCFPEFFLTCLQFQPWADCSISHSLEGTDDYTKDCVTIPSLLFSVCGVMNFKSCFSGLVVTCGRLFTLSVRTSPASDLVKEEVQINDSLEQIIPVQISSVFSLRLPSWFPFVPEQFLQF